MASTIASTSSIESDKARRTLLRYNHSLGDFDSVTIDDALKTSETLSESFKDSLESELDINNIVVMSYDAGSF
jgi:hypothetical protein